MGKLPGEISNADINGEVKKWRGAARWQPYIIGKRNNGCNDVLCYIGYSPAPNGKGEVVTGIRASMVSDNGGQKMQDPLNITRREVILAELILLQHYLFRIRSLPKQRKLLALKHSKRICEERGEEWVPGRITMAGSEAARNEMWPVVSDLLHLWLALSGTGAFMPFTDLWQGGDGVTRQPNIEPLTTEFFKRLERSLSELEYRNTHLEQELDDRIEAAMKKRSNADKGPRPRRYHQETAEGKKGKQGGVKLRSAEEMGLAKIEEDDDNAGA